MYWPHRALLSSHGIVINLVILELFIAFKWLESETNFNADEFMFFLSPLAIEWVSVCACLLRYVCNEVKKSNQNPEPVTLSVGLSVLCILVSLLEGLFVPLEQINRNIYQFFPHDVTYLSR